MSDIFHEVQEDLRRDRLKAFWDRWGGLVLVVAAVLVLAVGGWRGYEFWKARESAAAGDRFQAASKLAEDGKAKEAREAFAAIAADGPAGYRAIAKLREANETASEDPAAALKLYQAIAEDSASDPMLRDAARVRGAYLAVDDGTAEDVRKLADPLVAGSGPWRHLAREALGLAAYKDGDAAAARRNFEAVVSDPDAPAGARQRADLMLAVLPPAEAPAAAAGADGKPTN
ncbi:tetratricopeptide repeat protein [Hansschlegelia sp. KR7-227]|uniref:tetratricopeptide repeat protein n=1 Tax=Hansschlegelia sp. KR7-227 TaxID=3400914 RepID=UPI003C0A5C5F